MGKKMVVTEDVLLDCFRVFRGGHGHFLGVKSPWWANLMDPPEEQEVGGVTMPRWFPDSHQIYVAGKVIIEAFPKLKLNDRELLIARCGTGYKKSYRKCGKMCGLHHEVFRQQFQSAMAELQKVLDEMCKNS